MSKKWIIYVDSGEVLCVDSLVKAGYRLCNFLVDLHYTKLCYLLGYDGENDFVSAIRAALYVRSPKELDDVWVKVLKHYKKYCE